MSRLRVCRSNIYSESCLHRNFELVFILFFFALGTKRIVDFRFVFFLYTVNARISALGTYSQFRTLFFRWGGGRLFEKGDYKKYEFWLFVKTFFNIIVRHKSIANLNNQLLKRKEKYKHFEMKFEGINDYKNKAVFNLIFVFKYSNKCSL